MSDERRDYVAELLARREQDPATAAAGEVIDLSAEPALEGFAPADDPQGELHETLRRNAAGGDPAPHVSDDVLYARWKEYEDG